MAVAAKVIGAVRLGLVDVKLVIEELNTEEMQRIPEISKQLHEVQQSFSQFSSRESKAMFNEVGSCCHSPSVSDAVL